jgi:hypothetical protein
VEVWPTIFDLGTRWRCPGLHTYKEVSPCTLVKEAWVGSIAGLDAVEKRKFVA